MCNGLHQCTALNYIQSRSSMARVSVSVTARARVSARVTVRDRDGI